MTADLRDRLQGALSGSHQIHRELGGGGMSRVFLAEETRLGRKVVVKVLNPELAAGISADRFEREIRLAASLQQANIVPLLTAGDAEGLPYYTMPYVEGESLRSRLPRDGAPLPISDVVGILRDIARALAYAHEHGVVHRDIKPDNVLLSGGAAVVTDFGIAKAIAAARTNGNSDALTQAGTSLGTPAYMSPEQIAGDDVDHRSDLYALGCVAYELITGRVPFHGRSPQGMLGAHLSVTPSPVRDARPDCPPELAAMTERLLAKAPEDRPQSAAEVLKELQQATLGTSGEVATRAEKHVSLGRALAIYAAVFIAVALLARLAVRELGLPDWVFPATLIAMALGLPVILATALVHSTVRRESAQAAAGSAVVTRGKLSSLAMRAHPHVSWSRTAVGGALALGLVVIGVAAYMTLRAFGIGPAGSLFAAGKLDQQDKVIVADFRAPASDSALGAVVSEAVRTTLGQSRAVSVFPTSGISESLNRMKRPPDSRVDFPLAREIAEREGLRAVIHGDLAPAGAGYIITLRLAAAETGAELASFREAARDATDIIPAIDKLTRKLRGKMGESLKTVRASAPLMQVTTSSLPALRKYTEGMTLHYRQQDYVRAAQAFEEAIKLDSTFAMAYMRAGTSYLNASRNLLRLEPLRTKAFELRDRMPAFDRAMIESQYYFSTFRRDSAIAALERALAADPRNSTVLNMAAIEYVGLRQYVRAESAYRAAIAADPANPQPAANLVSALLNQGRFDDAERQIQNTFQKFPGQQDATLIARSAYIAYARGDLTLAERLIDSASRETRTRMSRGAMSDAASLKIVRGKLNEGLAARARNALEDVAVGSVRADGPALVLALDSAHTDVWYREDPASAERRLERVVATIPATVNQRGVAASLNRAAIIYARAGRPDRARALASRFATQFTDSLILRSMHVGRRLLQAEIALAERNYPEAIRLYRTSDSSSDGMPASCHICTDVRLGRAFDLAGMPDSAIARFERYLSAPYWDRFGTDADWRAGTHKRLGELYEAKGERQKALSHYLQFVNLWEDADPVLQPKVREVRSRIARLRQLEEPTAEKP